MDEETTNKSVKKIIIIEEQKKTTKKINCQKEKKMRVETKTWGLNEDDLLHETQLGILKSIHNKSIEKNTYISKMLTHIKSKICSYRQQDIVKKRLDKDLLVDFDEVINLLITCDMKCCYCSENVYILYEKVRESRQWSLDRINNDIGHNIGNLVIACLECNLKRRRTNKDAFMFTKNMVIIKEN
jgi:5-methylcytosine-specific restriction endonuclease McrA